MNSTDAADLSNLEIQIDPKDIGEDGYVSIWNVAAASANRETELTRLLASKLLCFLCKKACPFVVISSTDAQYLDEWFERDKTILHDWSPTSDRVDVVAQHACVPAQSLLDFLQTQKFNPATNHAATRARRLAWFQNEWNVG